MTDEQKKMLTKEILGECWHTLYIPVKRERQQARCSKCGVDLLGIFGDGNRSFTHWHDLGDLKKRIVESGKWYDFFDYVRDSYVKTVRSEIGYADFVLWLFTPDRFCELVAEWWTERGM